MTTFDVYEEEFTALMEQIQQRLAAATAKKSINLDDEQQYSSTRDQKSTDYFYKDLLQQCDDLIKQMALEARSGEGEHKQQMLDKVKAYKAQYHKLVQQTDRQGLFGTTGSTKNACSKQERLSLDTNEDKMAAQNDSLERARRSMQETEQVAASITEELDHNRETMTRTHESIRQVSSLTERAMGILSRLKK